MKIGKKLAFLGLSVLGTVSLASCDMAKFISDFANGVTGERSIDIPSSTSTINTPSTSQATSKTSTSTSKYTPTSSSKTSTTTSRYNPTSTTTRTTPTTTRTTTVPYTSSSRTNIPSSSRTNAPTASNAWTTPALSSTTTIPSSSQTSYFPTASSTATEQTSYFPTASSTATAQTSNYPTGTSTNPYQSDLGTLNVYINYTGKSGITLRNVNEYYNPIEDKNYVKGDLLPVWEELQNRLGCRIYDAANYAQTSDNDVYKHVIANNYMSDTDPTKYIDLLYNTTSNIEKMGAAGEAVDLVPYIHDGSMPNFKRFLEDNPSVWNQIARGGKIYYSPYFDGYNDIERMFIMDVNMVKKVLDFDDQTKDTVKNQGRNEYGLTAVKFQPFIDENYNYSSNTPVIVSKNAMQEIITIKKTDNIIKLQNNIMNQTGGASGADLRQQLRNYLQAAFGDYVGNGKLYENYSDIFISESAAYNTDELIALMRVIKASPELISGNPNNEIEIMCPRGQANNRVQNIMMFMKIFGIQGVDAEKDYLYFDSNGNLNDMASTKASYEALALVSQLYDEGLILGDFYMSAGANSGTFYLNKYFSKTYSNSGYGFMLYDYSSAISQVNTKDENGIGTSDSSRYSIFKDTSVTGVRPVLSPLTYWATGVGTNAKNDSLMDRSNKTLLRYEESNRGYKNNSWCIPSCSSNILGAVKLMDYFYSEEGRILNDFGPSRYWKSNAYTYQYYDELMPEFNDTAMQMIFNANCDSWTALRSYLGATHGIGYMRSATLNYIVMNYYGAIGQRYIDNSIISGATTLCLYDNAPTATFGTSVPYSGYESISKSVSDTYDEITSFWADDKLLATACGWAKVIVTPYEDIDYTLALGVTKNTKVNYVYGDVQNQIQNRINYYLYSMANSFGAVPSYAI